MDNFNDKKENDENNYYNWQQNNNNNIDNCLNNVKDNSEVIKWKRICNKKDPIEQNDEECIEINNGCNNLEKLVNEENINEYLFYNGDDEEKSDDSTENLSILNDNDLIDDIILLPENILSDDELSNPDNCVYAYRGSPEPLIRLQQSQEDETDFLEMDFDPEPNSEADSSLFEINNLENSINISNACKNLIKSNEKCYEFDKQIHYSSLNDVQDKILSESNKSANENINHKEIINKQIDNSQQINNKNENDHLLNNKNNNNNNNNNISNNNNNNNINNINNNISDNRLPIKNTGTIPKKPLDSFKVVKVNNSTSSLNGHLNNETSHENLRSNHSSINYIYNKNLSNPKCDEINKSYKRIDDGFSNLYSNSNLTYKNSEKEEINITSSFNEFKEIHQFNNSHKNPVEYSTLNNKESKSRILENEKNTINIYSVNCDEKTLIDALESIGLEPNKNILKQYYIENYENDLNLLNIPEYLIYLSKQNCNYKKLIQVIKTSCTNDNLKITFHAFNDFNIYPDTVKVPIKEIIKRWNPETNLNRLLTFKNKRFNEMNILGKIVNILRQTTQRRECEMETLILIPQYYKSGYIRVTKLQ